MAISIDRRDITGKKTGTVALDDEIFGVQPNVPVMHQVVSAQLAAARRGTQSTKTRAEVAGGGRKPFKQKGTGRARQGSERAPHFTGGGIALGPKPRSYRQKTPRKMIQLALRSALSDRASEGKVAVVDEWSWDAPSTKSAKTALAELGFEGKVLVVLSRDDEDAYKSFRNLPAVQAILAAELNAYDVLCNDWIVFTGATLPGAAGQTPASTPADEAEVQATEPTEAAGVEPEEPAAAAVEPATAASTEATDEEDTETEA